MTPIAGPGAPVSSHAITVDGVRQSFQVAGQGPLCLVHGGGPGVHWPYLRLPRLEQYLTVVYLEPIGTGASGMAPDGDYSIPRYARMALAVAEQLTPQPVYFLGHSHGGFVGLQFALDYPERLAGLILYDSAPAWGAEAFEEATRGIERFAGQRPGHPGVPEVVQAWHSQDATDSASFRDFLRRLLPAYFADYWGREAELRPWASALEATFDPGRKADPWDVRDVLETITTRTQVIVGQHDFICGPRWATQLTKEIPGARLVVLENSGHFGHLEEPKLFEGAIADFVR
jgi:pimeloyl-ACP methyl ester carboxylesterase